MEYETDGSAQTWPPIPICPSVQHHGYTSSKRVQDGSAHVGRSLTCVAQSSSTWSQPLAFTSPNFMSSTIVSPRMRKGTHSLVGQQYAPFESGPQKVPIGQQKDPVQVSVLAGQPRLDSGRA